MKQTEAAEKSLKLMLNRFLGDFSLFVFSY